MGGGSSCASLGVGSGSTRAGAAAESDRGPAACGRSLRVPDRSAALLATGVGLAGSAAAASAGCESAAVITAMVGSLVGVAGALVGAAAVGDGVAVTGASA